MTSIAKVHACFGELGLGFELRRFDSRLMAQKVVYLLQELGVQLGYEYNFYVRGTYSPDLTKDLFQHPEPTEHVDLNAAEHAAIERLRQNVELRPHMLEVMASYRFLRRQGRDQTDALATIKRTKPFIPERDVAVGVSRCKRLFPEVTEEDRESLREEMAPWDEATDRNQL